MLEHLENATIEANPELMRLAFKLATGAGETTVMAMLIACKSSMQYVSPKAKSLAIAS